MNPQKREEKERKKNKLDEDQTHEKLLIVHCFSESGALFKLPVMIAQ